MSRDSATRVAIIGAGIAGISCARVLADASLEVVVFEKSRSFGGRCSTRLWQEHIVDHGAQYFTARDPDFLSTVQAACGDDLLAITSPILDAQGLPLPAEGRPRFYHRNGNNRLARALAAGIEVRREYTLEKLMPSAEGWELQFAGGAVEKTSAVVLTSPWPQTAQLLDLSDASCFEPCLTGFFACEGEPSGLAADCYGRMGDREGALSWSACENHKTDRIRPGATVFVVQSGPSFSREHLEAPGEDWLALQRAELAEAWQISSTRFTSSFGHRWRYARNLAPVAASALPTGIFVAGDSFVSSRLEDVWLSGRACAHKISEEFRKNLPPAC